MLRHLAEQVGHLPGDQAEIPRIARYLYVGEPTDQPIERSGAGTLEQGFSSALAPLAIDHVGSFDLHEFDHRQEQFRRVLEIGVDQQDERAGTGGDACRERQLVAMIAAQADTEDAGIRGRRGRDDVPAIVVRAVIHQDDLITPIELLADGLYATQKLRQYFLFVEARSDDREAGWVNAHGWLYA